MPNISVLLTVYNGADFVEQSIRSVLSQTLSDFFFIIIDDGSTDNTVEIIQSIQDHRIELWKQDHQGRTASLNYGLSKTKTKYIAMMDADDICVPWRLEKQLSIFEQLPRNTILSSWYAIFSNRTIHHCVRTPTTSEEIKKGLLLYSYISQPGMMCYKETIVNNGGYCTNVEIDAFQDYETWLTIKEKVEFFVIPEILVFQRYRHESLSNNLHYKQRIVYAIQQPYYDNLQYHFGINDHTEEMVYRGWREYFYGTKNKARDYWREAGLPMLFQPKLLLAWVVTLLPEDIFVKFKETRMRYRMSYIVAYFSTQSRSLRSVFKKI